MDPWVVCEAVNHFTTRRNFKVHKLIVGDDKYLADELNVGEILSESIRQRRDCAARRVAAMAHINHPTQLSFATYCPTTL